MKEGAQERNQAEKQLPLTWLEQHHEVGDLPPHATLIELERLEQRGQGDLESRRQLSQGLQGRRKRPVFKPADRVGRQPRGLRERLLREPPRSATRPYMTAEVLGVATSLAHGDVPRGCSGWTSKTCEWARSSPNISSSTVWKTVDLIKNLNRCGGLWIWAERPTMRLGRLPNVSAVARRAQALMDQVRRRLVELSELSPEELSEMGSQLPAELAGLADLVARAQGLTSGDDPLSGTYRQELANLRTWLRAHGAEPECPVSPDNVAAWLDDLARERAAVTVKRYVAAVRAWHRATGHADPTANEIVRPLLDQLG